MGTPKRVAIALLHGAIAVVLFAVFSAAVLLFLWFALGHPLFPT